MKVEFGNIERHDGHVGVLLKKNWMLKTNLTKTSLNLLV